MMYDEIKNLLKLIKTKPKDKFLLIPQIKSIWHIKPDNCM